MHFPYKLLSLPIAYRWAGRLLPWLSLALGLSLIYGLWGGLVLAPAEERQGEVFRILYVHVPCAFCSLLVYGLMGLAAICALIWQLKLADLILEVSASIGACFTFLALVTGAIWGRPTWGTWWIWDARLSSELILLFLYMGVIALRQAIPEPRAAARACALLVVIGIIDLPIIHYSVYWWNTLHQRATLLWFAAPLIDSSMLYPAVAMILAAILYGGIVLLYRLRTAILDRERHCQWVQAALNLTYDSDRG